MSENKMGKKQFVETILSEVLHIASGNGYIGHEDKNKYWIDRLIFDDEKEIVTIVCENEHTYKVNVGGESHLAIIEDVMKKVMHH